MESVLLHHARYFCTRMEHTKIQRTNERKNTRILQEKNNLGHHERELPNQQMSTQCECQANSVSVRLILSLCCVFLVASRGVIQSHQKGPKTDKRVV